MPVKYTKKRKADNPGFISFAMPRLAWICLMCFETWCRLKERNAIHPKFIKKNTENNKRVNPRLGPDGIKFISAVITITKKAINNVITSLTL